MNHITVRVDGIRSDTEKQQIKNALDKFEGVRNVAVDPKTRSISVKFNAPSTEQEIVDCIIATGHDLQ